MIYVCIKDDLSDASSLYALKNSDGKESWEAPAALPFGLSSSPVISGNMLYLPLAHGRVAAVGRDAGKIVWEYRIATASNHSTATTTGSALSRSGTAKVNRSASSIRTSSGRWTNVPSGRSW